MNSLLHWEHQHGALHWEQRHDIELYFTDSSRYKRRAASDNGATSGTYSLLHWVQQHAGLHWECQHAGVVRIYENVVQQH